MNGPDLGVELGALRLPNPVLAASGTFASGREAAEVVALDRLGALVVKSMTAVPWQGRPPPRMAETPSGMLNSIGIQNKGVDAFLEEDLPWLRQRGVRVIASIAGNTVGEYELLASKIGVAGRGVVAVEVNISCPNLEDRGNLFAHSPKRTAEVVATVRSRLGDKPLFAKLSPNVTDLREIAVAAVEAGADGLSLINTVLGMAIDIYTRRPKLAGIYGGLSGPAVRPIAVRAVHEVHTSLPGVPIIGQGGIRKGEDAVEMMLAGASAVAVGTANFGDPRAPLIVLGGIEEYLLRTGTASARELTGALR